MSYETRSAVDMFFSDGNFGHFAEDRNWFSEKTPEAPAPAWEAPRNHDGSVQTYKNEIPKLAEEITLAEQDGDIDWGNRLDLAGMKIGHFFHDLF